MTVLSDSPEVVAWAWFLAAATNTAVSVGGAEVAAKMAGEVCRVCGEPLSERYRQEVAHWWHEPGCKNRTLREQIAQPLGVVDCDCSGYVHPHCCGCELEHPVEEGENR